MLGMFRPKDYLGNCVLLWRSLGLLVNNSIVRMSIILLNNIIDVLYFLY